MCYNGVAENKDGAKGKIFMQKLIQQTNAYTLIKNGAEQLHHAYLLLFPDGEFLRESMPYFAELFFNSDRAKEQVKVESFADCLFSPVKGEKFSVADAEKIAEEAVLKPIEGDRKLFVICDFSEATPQAQNKLLKILEEPPKGVCFLLGASVLSPVLPTILSRVEKVEIPPFTGSQIASYLRRTHPEAPFIKETAEACGGLPKKAEAMLEGGFLSELSEVAYLLLTAPKSKIPALSRKYAETKYKKELVSLLRMILRDALVLKSGQDTPLLVPFQREKTAKVAGVYAFNELFDGQKALSRVERDLRFNGVFAQAIELFLLSMKR